MAPSSTLPTTWSTAWNSRFGAPSRLHEGRRPRDVAGQVGAAVAGAVDQGVPGVAVGGDRADPHGAVLVGDVVRLREDGRALRPRVGDAAVDVGHLQGDVDDAVAVPAVVVGQRAVRVVGAGDDEPGRAGLQDEAVVVAVAGLRAAVRDELHAERRLEEVRRLDGVADDPDQRVPARHRERVARLVVLDEAHQLLELVEVEVGQAFLVVQRLLEAHRRSPPAGVTAVSGEWHTCSLRLRNLGPDDWAG